MQTACIQLWDDDCAAVILEKAATGEGDGRTACSADGEYRQIYPGIIQCFCNLAMLALRNIVGDKQDTAVTHTC